MRKRKKKSIINKVVSLVLLEKETTREREKEREDVCVCVVLVFAYIQYID